MAIIVVQGYQIERYGLGKSGSDFLNFIKEQYANPQTIIEVKAANENKTSNEPIHIKNKLNTEETKRATIGVPPLLTVVPFSIKKPSRLNP